ncbi:MAG TPA: hypothetical protein DCK95_12370 [Anaerolineaceae bacterium]|nr:hypothetical protein [Anaerolineaceae bacterium]
MKSNLIVMLTHDDKTVPDALEVFESCRDLPVSFWGFKNVGLPRAEMQDLIKAIKNAGKTTFLEIVSYTKDECMTGAQFAVDFGFDYLMGTLFFPEVWDFLKKKEIKYFPFVGKVSGSPSILEGTTSSMVEESEFFRSQGVDGVDLLAFRHKENPERLARDFISQSKIPVILAGSIESYERINFVNQVNPWGFTMGSALFNKDFSPNGSFRENLEKVVNRMASIK